MKKIVNLLAAGFIFVSPALADELKVGGYMPKLNYDENSLIKTWESDSHLKKGIILFLDRNKDGNSDVMIGFVECSGKLNTLPFGIYDSFKEKLYLDNSPTDGKIDKIFEKDIASKRNVVDDAPECNRT